MKVAIKDLAVDMDIKTKGVTMSVSDNSGKHKANATINKTGVNWRLGKTAKENGVMLTWKELESICSSSESLKAALESAKDYNKKMDTNT